MRDNRSRWGRRWTRALLVLALACGGAVAGCDDEKKPDGVAPTKTQEVAPSGPIEELKAPAEVVTFGGSDSLVSLAKKIGAVGGPMGSAAVNPAMIGKGMAKTFGLKNDGAFALDKPFRFAMVDPKNLKEPIVLIVSMTSKDELVALLPQDHKKDDRGNAISYPVNGETVYLSFIDEFAVFSQDVELFAQQKAFLVQLAGSKVGSEGVAVVSASNATKMYAKELTDAVAEAEKALAKQPGMPMGGDGMKKMAQWFATTAKELDRVVIRLDGLADGGKLAFDLIPKEGSDLKKTFGALGKQKLELLDEVPADAPMAMVAAMDPDSTGELTQSLTAWSLQLSLGDDVDEELEQAMDDYWKASTGQMAFAAHAVPNVEGLRFSGLFGVRDAEKARAAQKVLRGIYQRDAFKKTYDELGVTMTFKPAAYTVGDVPVDRVEAKLDDTAGNANLGQALGPSAALFSDLMNTHVAIASPLGVMAYGQDGKAVIEAWLGGDMPGGLDQTPGMVRALKHAAPGLFMVMYGKPLEVMKAMGVAAPQGGQADQGGDSGLALSAGADEGTLHVVLDLPTTQVAALMGAAMTMKGGMGAPTGPRGL